MPLAVNLPVLDDGSAHSVGTLHRGSTFDARRIGAALVARNIARHLDTALADKPRGWRPLVYCWRGGQRSGAFVHVLERIGWHARQLDGGYRAYRRAVVADARDVAYALRLARGLRNDRQRQEPAVAAPARLRRTGARPGGLAHHRGSVLGAMPALPQPSQKMFESRLWWAALRSFDPCAAGLRRIGEPQGRRSACARCSSSARCARRVACGSNCRSRHACACCAAEYEHFEAHPDLLERQLDCLSALHGKERVAYWKDWRGTAPGTRMVERLLVEHYDPAYLRSIRRNFVQVEAAQTLALASDAEAEFDALARRLAA